MKAQIQELSLINEDIVGAYFGGGYASSTGLFAPWKVYFCRKKAASSKSIGWWHSICFA